MSTVSTQLFLSRFGDPEIFPSKTNLHQNIKPQIFSPFSLWPIPANPVGILTNSIHAD